MSATVHSEVRAEPNLTPLLDIVFQLITFFMLVINFSNDAYDQRIRLPVAGSARPVEPSKAVEDHLILNIDDKGQMLFNGEVLDTEKAIAEIGIQAELIRANARFTKLKIDEATGLPTTLVIRADKDTPFSLLHRIITACQANGFHKYNLKAMTDEG